MEWIKFDEQMPKETESMFAEFYGTLNWIDGVMFKTVRYGLLFTIEHKGKRIVVDGKIIDGIPKCEYGKLHPDIKYIAWTPYPDPFELT